MEQPEIITKVEEREDGFEVNCNGLGFCLNKKFWNNFIPKVGDKINLYTIKGSCIRGIDLNGEKVFYKSDEQLEEERIEQHKKYQLEKEETFKKEKKHLDEIYDSLPDPFKKRIDIFRNNNEKFRVNYESYELFCCSEAVTIAKALKTPKAVKEFSESKDYDKHKLIPNLSDGHSGNTFGMATNLAYWYLKEPESIYKIAGALSPLVGSKEYEEKNKRKKLKNSDKK